ncbi:lytic transglycosylase domain-containing protein [Shimia ponticola]|uniref:lytic transglycosylase domain-containing protein n=1 Tax=Shimia ponticola TaxID=2582893 RepID=UPI0011BF9E02|nr:lytic transglycosylase domain-containing protein [Shimia ponticola]
MRQIAFTALALTLSLWASLGSANGSVRALEQAMDAVRAKDWDAARTLAASAGPVGRDIIEWHTLRAGEGSFERSQAFVSRRGDWPGLPYLVSQSEDTIPQSADTADVLTFFGAQKPRHGTGSLRLAAALRASGQSDAARAEIVRAWTSLSLSVPEEAAFMATHGSALARHHWERADMLMWRGLTAEAKRMLPRLSDDDRTLAEARIALRDGTDGIDAFIDAVPASRAGDPGLAYERFLWRANRGRTLGAIEVMEGQRNLGEPERWGNLRRRYARQLMRDGQDRRAYRLAANHGLSEGRHFADLEWLAGYIALRKLRDADTALRHFERFEAAVDTPISLARAAYWQGRAHEQVGNTAWAREDYLRGADHQTAFYGLLSAERADVPMDPKLTGRETFPDWRTAAFTQSTVFEAAMLLLAAGELSLAERFLTHLAESLDRTQIGQMAAMVQQMNQPHLEVMIAKRGVQYGHVIEGPYYALHPLAANSGSVPPELALAIARRESEFDPAVTSGVGARGLMQLMPATAQEMAGDVGEPFSNGRLLTDGDYNARLGTAYLRELIAQFGQSPVQISVAYNAGPSRAVSWVNDRGNPRDPRVDIVDWIEHIPFRETRNYVMRVTESLPIYRARLSGRVEPIRFTQELRGNAPTAADSAAYQAGLNAGPPESPWAPLSMPVELRPRVRP